MARRSVFVSRDEYPFFEEIAVEFDWFPGFALSQKRKSQISLHKNFQKRFPEHKVLEISSASLYSLGSALSAMSLTKMTSQGITSVESAFQSSRIYGSGDLQVGPFPEYMFLPGRECKRLVKEASKGQISYRYHFDGMDFYAPEYHISLFYDYLYLNALLEDDNSVVSQALTDGGYTAFTDLATLSLNCQARSAAIFVSLMSHGFIDEIRNYDSFLRLFRTNKKGTALNSTAYDNVQLLQKDGKVQLLSPVIPHSFYKEQTEAYYLENCGSLTNRKTSDNYLNKVYVQNKQ